MGSIPASRTTFRQALERSALDASAEIPRSSSMERAMGIEPTLSAWEAEVLPLNYARMDDILAAKLHSARQPLSRVARRKQSSLGERR